MGMGTRRRRQRQEQIWIAQQELAKGSAHPFYQRVNELLEEKKFDEFAERECAKFYAETMGRPSVAPGIYFRLLLVGYHEHQPCLSPLRVPLGGGLPDRLPAESESVPNLRDAPIVGSLCSGFDRAVRLALAAIIHFFSTDVTRWTTLRKAGFLTRDTSSITVRWACK